MKANKIICLFIICELIVSPLLAFVPAPARAQTDQTQIDTDTPTFEDVDEILDVNWPEPDFDPNEVQTSLKAQEKALKFDALENQALELKNLFDLVDRGRLVVSEDDLEAIRTGKIDERILKTLIYLVTPVDQGGAGFERIKVQRLIKGYTTKKRAISRETEYADESEANISAHYFGQAVDISEIDLIRMKKKTKKKAFGITLSSKTAALPSIPIKVAWQSEKGKGEEVPGFYGETANQLFDNLSLGSLKEVLSDFLDYDIESLKGESLPEWTKWLGVIMLFEDFDLPVEGFKEGVDFKGMLKEMGRATIAESLNIDKEAIKGNSREELILNIGKSYLETKLGLEQGSLTGDSLDEILKNAGRRKLEAELGLQKGDLDGDLKTKLNKIKANAKWTKYKTYEAKDAALDMPEGSAEKIEAGDDSGLALIGAGVLVYVLSIENAKDLYDKIKRKEPITINLKIDEASLKVDIDTDILKKIISSDKNIRKEALKSIGEKTLSALVLHPDLSLGLTKKEWEKVIQGQMPISDLALMVGARKFETEFDLPNNALYYTLKSGKPENLLLYVGQASLEEEGKNTNKFTDEQKKEIGRKILKEKIARNLNNEFRLSEKYEITDSDIIDLFNGKWESFAQKIAAKQIDKALKLPENGTMDIITGKKRADEVLKESGAIRFGRLLGLSRPVSIEGNLKQNYGQALVEENLGLRPNSFKGSIGEVKAQNADKFDSVFKEPEKIDGIFGLNSGTTKGLLEGKISVSDYSSKVAEKAFAQITLDKIANYFGLESWKQVEERKKEFDNMIKTLQNWNAASPQDRLAVFSTFEKISGHSFDEILGFEAGTIESIIANPSKAPDILLTQGMKKLNQMFGFDKEVIILRYQEGKGLEVTIDGKALKDWATPKIKEITGIENEEDAKTFLNGNIKDGFVYWGMASMVKEANEFLPDDAKLSYDEAKRLYFGDPELEQAKINEALSQLPTTATPEQKEEVVQMTKTQVRGELRKEFQYRVYDGYLRKLDPNIPVGFTKVLFEGTPEQRTTMLGAYAINLITGGKIPVTPEQLKALNDYLNNKTPENFNKLKEAGVFGVLDNYLSRYKIFNVPILSGFSEALFDGMRTGNYTKLNNLYKDWATDQIFNFADAKLKLPAGTSYKIYEKYQNYRKSLDAYSAVKNTQDAEAISNAKANLKQAKLDGIDFVVQIAFRKSFSKLDQKLGLPPGTTSGLVSLLITGNPAGLIMAAVMSFVKVKVEFYGEKPICEREVQETSQLATKASSIFTTLLGKSPSWERLSGDPEKDFPFYQRHAQCAVKRLVGALLDIPEKTGDKTLLPLQILVQRPEDVDYYANKVFELYGKTKVERGWRGLYANDLMWRWVHIGY